MVRPSWRERDRTGAVRRRDIDAERIDARRLSMPVQNSALSTVYSRWERFINSIEERIPLGDRNDKGDLGGLSDKISDLRRQALSDGQLTAGELDQLYAKMEQVTRAYTELAKQSGFVPDTLGRPTTQEGFRFFVENMQIQMQTFGGKDTRGGLAGDLMNAVKQGGANALAQPATRKLLGQIALELMSSPEKSVAEAKLNILKASLARVGDGAVVKKALDEVRAKLQTEISDPKWNRAGRTAALDVATFDRLVSFSGAVTVKSVELPAEVKGTNELFPKKPIAGWTEAVHKQIAAGMDDMERAGKFLLDNEEKIKPGETKKVTMKLDLNYGIDAEPSVSSYAQTYATLTEMLNRADKRGQALHFVVGDSCGLENAAFGRTTMEIVRDTGQMHAGLQAGLEFAKKQAEKSGDTAKVAQIEQSLAKIKDCETKGVFFAGRDDKASTKTDIDQAIALAKPFVELRDFDVNGFTPVMPDVGAVGEAAHGSKEFQLAKDWVDADLRIHATRGLSTHILAGWTGATKGLIGLHAFGLRPVDQGMEKRGDRIEDMFTTLSGVGGFAAVFARRAGVIDMFDRIMGGDNPELKAKAKEAESLWNRVEQNGAAFGYFKSEVAKLKTELQAMRRNGRPETEIVTRLKWGIQEALNEANERAPGFRQALWDATAAMTKVILPAARHFRFLLPTEMKDEQAGARIGLLTKMPMQSDFVVQTQAKVGLGGGPDAYHEVRDVGVITMGTDEASVDISTWKELEKRGAVQKNVYEDNFPIWASVMHGVGPAYREQIEDLGD
jgi:hypothetical protein